MKFWTDVIIKGICEIKKKLVLNSEGTTSDVVYIEVTKQANPPAIRWNGATGKWQYSNNGVDWQDIGTGGGGLPKSYACEYLLYESGHFSGNVHFQLQISKLKDFSTLEVSLDTGTSQSKWVVFTGTEFIDFPASGMPSTYEKAVYTGLTFADTDIRYVRWRAYQGSDYGDWICGIMG